LDVSSQGLFAERSGLEGMTLGHVIFYQQTTGAHTTYSAMF